MRPTLLTSLAMLILAITPVENLGKLQAQETPATTIEAELDPTAQPDTQPLNTPNHAVSAALQDLLSVPQTERPFQYYVWLRDGDIEKAQRCNFMINNVVVEMSSTRIAHPVVINDGYLLRYDTRTLGPEDLARMHRLLDKVIDPCFYLVKDEVIRTRIPVAPYRASDGNTYDYRIEERTVTAFGNTVADVYEDALALQAISGRMVPIVSYEYFMTKTQSTTNGGMYYDFIGVRDIKPKAGQNQLDAYLELHAGVSLTAAVKEYVDQRTVTIISDITGKERMVVSYQGHRTKIGRNAGVWSFTLDVGERELGGDQSAIRNLGSLLNPLYRFSGGEAIGERMNGGNVYLLFDADLKFVDEAPGNLTVDHLIPKKHGTARLEPPISCYRCHTMKEHPDDPEPAGWKAISFDAQDLLLGKVVQVGGQDILIGLDPVGDIQELEVLAGRYQADFNKPLRRSREDLSDFIVQCTTTPEMSTNPTLNGISLDWSRQHYDRVAADTVCYELGIPVPQGVNPVDAFRTAVFRRTSAMPTQDPFIIRLLLGGEIRRETWETILQDVARLVTPEDVLQSMHQLKVESNTTPQNVSQPIKD